MAESASQNGHKSSNGKVRVAIVGVGNCASSLVQGIEYYRDADPNETVPGLMHVDLGGYHVSDIEFSAAFDVDVEKVGQDLGTAIFRGQNNTVKFSDVPDLGVEVQRGMTHDGLGKYLSKVITKAPGETADVADILRATKTDVVVSYLPVGSEEATKWYVEQVLAAGCGFVNCVPVFIAREPYWRRRFEQAGVPIVGDDIKSQVGATIVHRKLARLFQDRGVLLERTHQLNVGGNTDFLNMLERERLESKKISKTNAVTSQLDYDIGADNVHIGPSDHVAWLHDRKWAYIRLEGRSFGDVPLNIELKLEVVDSPNSAGIVIDAVRCAKLGLDNGLSRRAGMAGCVLHEVAAGAAPRRSVPRPGRGVHPHLHAAAEEGLEGVRRGLTAGAAMSLKLCLVCPYTLTGAHPVAEHVRGVATGLADRGHLVTVLAPSSSSHALRAGRRRLRALAGGDTDAVTALDGQPLVVAVRPRFRCGSVGGGEELGLPVAASANVALAVREGKFDIVHAHDPLRPGVATAALKHSQGLTAATFHATVEPPSPTPCGPPHESGTWHGSMHCLPPAPRRPSWHRSSIPATTP